MKHLRNYVEEEQTKLFNKTGTFFAFSDKQLNESRKENVEYVSLGYGMICPKENAKEVISGLEAISKKGIAADIKENGISAIIHRELGNHEAQITGEVEDTMSSLCGYGVTEEQVKEEYSKFYQHCVDNDYF